MSRHCSRSLYKIHARSTDLRDQTRTAILMHEHVQIIGCGTSAAGHVAFAEWTDCRTRNACCSSACEERSREQNAMLALASVELTGEKVGSDNGCTTLGVRRYGLPTPSLQASGLIAAQVMDVQTSRCHMGNMRYH